MLIWTGHLKRNILIENKLLYMIGIFWNDGIGHRAEQGTPLQKGDWNTRNMVHVKYRTVDIGINKRSFMEVSRFPCQILEIFLVCFSSVTFGPGFLVSRYVCLVIRDRAISRAVFSILSTKAFPETHPPTPQFFQRPTPKSSNFVQQEIWCALKFSELSNKTRFAKLRCTNRIRVLPILSSQKLFKFWKSGHD